MRLILASQSPRRAQLVKLLGIADVTIMPCDVDETLEWPTPEATVTELALRKARALLGNAGLDSLILAADTIVVLGEAILGKPTDADDAIRMLGTLSGRTHTVYTGVALIDTSTKEEVHFVEHTDVTFRTLVSEEIAAYVATGAPLDKAGAYGIQEDFGAVFVSRIDGDYYNVVGLPLSSLYSHLKRFAPKLF
jgi:septum formation protein